jgi:pimeloyl-ACP methyl ester carboxylesterase
VPRDVAIVFVHGIQARDFDYSVPMRTKVLKALPRSLRPHAKFRSVFWADIVRGRSQLYLQQALLSTHIADTSYRRLVVEGLGDAAAYQKTRSRDNSAYYQIQERITNVLRDADAREDPNRPLIFIGHSLGCHIVSSYAWDINRLKQMTEEQLAGWDDTVATSFVAELRAASPFRQLGTFAGFVTMGSNMPLFTFMFGPDKVYPITRYPDASRLPAFPGANLPAAVAAKARWLNFYSPSDILGYPLKCLNNAYREEKRLSDWEVISEGYLRSRFLPASMNAMRAHTGYWTNRTVVRQSSTLIASIITAEDKPG